ncbi:MAG: hypothetical protein KatS3mg096_543 [Candidatus Parcubacteria bacterium]|nr:MAG: hypothetical protein KatS3mg096_543 [Candidatus Parcubacteria bacterium]
MKERIIKFLKNKKIIFLLIFLIGGASYFGYSKFKRNQVSEGYILAQVKRGSVQKIVTGTGYVTTTDAFEIKPSDSGKISNIYVGEGEYVNKGMLLFALDDSDIKRQIRDLELDIESSKLNLQKTKDDYQRILRGDDLRKNYESLLKNLNDIFVSYPDDLEKIRKVYFEKELDNLKHNLDYYLYYFPGVKITSDVSQKIYNNLKTNFLLISQRLQEAKFNNQNIDYSLIKDSYDFLLQTQDFIKSGLDLIRRLKEDLSLQQSYHTKQEIIDRHYNDLNLVYSKYADHLNNLSSLVNALNSYQDSLKQKEYDIQSLELSIKQKENKLEDLRDDLKDYYIYAPISGIMQDVNVKTNDSVSSNSVLAKLLSNEKTIEVSLNEIDAAEVKVGQDAIITFDALPELELKGKVFYISPVGEVEQGVVNYLVKVSLEDNSEVKIGMTANVEIITQSKENVLIIPNSAIKNFESRNYVEVPDDKENLREIHDRPIKLTYPLKRVFIQKGISDSNNTEVIEGLKEGDIIVVRKIENNFDNKQSQGLFQRFLPNPRQFAPQSRPQNIQR